MRVYGRVTDALGNKRWVVVETDANGDNSYCYVTALAQTIKLNLNESPFWANYGIPAKSAVVQQLPPDIHMSKIVSFYSQFFPALAVSKRAPKLSNPEPVYDVRAMRADGSLYQTQIGV